MATETAEARLRLDQFSTCVTGTEQDSVRAALGASSASSQAMAFPAGTTVPEHGTLIVTTEGQAGPLEDVVAVVRTRDPAMDRELRFGDLVAGAPIILDLGYLLGRELVSVELKWKDRGDAQAESPVREASLYRVRASR